MRLGNFFRMMFTRPRCGVWVLVVILLWIRPVLAVVAEGRVIFMSGAVEIQKDGEWLEAQAGSLVTESDRVRIGADSLAILQLSTGATIKLRENTQITLQEISSGMTEVQLDSGGVYARVLKSHGNSDHFQVRTPVAVAAVRGTQFFVGYSGSRDAWLSVNEGEVAVTPAGGAGARPVSVGSGLGVTVNGKGEVSKPSRADWSRELNWNLDPKKGEVADKSRFMRDKTDLLNYDY